MNMNLRQRVLLITTGGTITMTKNDEGCLIPCNDLESFRSLVPELDTIAEVAILSLVNLDSANIQPDLWVSLAQTIFDRLDAYDGFVVTHGTDTLSYTAAALSFMLQELGKPVVITGSQLPLGELGSDAHCNLINSFRVAVSELADVAVVFGSFVIKGSRAKKISAFDLQAFHSVNHPPLGTIGLSIKFEGDIRTRSKRKPLICTSINPNVALIPVYPGLKPELIMYIASTHAGIVLEGYGSGNIPNEGNSLVSSIQAATAIGVPVVVCTQCLLGSTEMELYHVGRTALSAGAIPAMDMTPETTLVKLMWVLGQTENMSTIDFLMQKSFAGELHEKK